MLLRPWRPVGLAGAGRLERRVRQQLALWPKTQLKTVTERHGRPVPTMPLGSGARFRRVLQTLDDLCRRKEVRRRNPHLSSDRVDDGHPHVAARSRCHRAAGRRRRAAVMHWTICVLPRRMQGTRQTEVGCRGADRNREGHDELLGLTDTVRAHTDIRIPACADVRHRAGRSRGHPRSWRPQ